LLAIAIAVIDETIQFFIENISLHHRRRSSMLVVVLPFNGESYVTNNCDISNIMELETGNGIAYNVFCCMQEDDMTQKIADEKYCCEIISISAIVVIEFIRLCFSRVSLQPNRYKHKRREPLTESTALHENIKFLTPPSPLDVVCVGRKVFFRFNQSQQKVNE